MTPTTLPPELLEVRQVEDVTVVKFLSRSLLDPLSIESAGERLAAAVRSGRPRLLFDFSRVESVASAMIGRLLALNQVVEQAGGRVAFCGVGPFLAQIFSLCRLPATIAVLPDEAAALAALRG